MTVVFEQTPHLLQARTVLLCCYLLHFSVVLHQAKWLVHLWSYFNSVAVFCDGLY